MHGTCRRTLPTTFGPNHFVLTRHIRCWAALSGEFDPNLGALPYSQEEYDQLCSVQRFLATALGQCLTPLARRPNAGRSRLIVGSTGDGIREFDEALLVAGLTKEVIPQLPLSDAEKSRLEAAVAQSVGRCAEDTQALAPYPAFLAVAQRMIGSEADVLAVDAACASSLYAVDLGVKSLRAGNCDIAFCGGAFAPGPANSCLFSQFRGLTTTGSRPFDRDADGVAFGEGAALLTLKRLADAVADGDTIHGVIRHVGTSDDGKSRSAAEPRKEGQVLAIQRAWQRAGLDPDTAQYIEAHATSTPVGDAVEFSALEECFGNRRGERPSIQLGSVKAVIGHTGWAAGAASLVKMCKALQAKQFPPQANFDAPSPAISLHDSAFSITKQARDWPANESGCPRRVGVNGFGFGGSNAHVILERV